MCCRFWSVSLGGNKGSLILRELYGHWPSSLRVDNLVKQREQDMARKSKNVYFIKGQVEHSHLSEFVSSPSGQDLAHNQSACLFLI